MEHETPQTVHETPQNLNIIIPIIGSTMWYRPTSQYVEHTQPLAAIVSYVHSPKYINCMVIDRDGSTFPVTSVLVVQENDPRPIDCAYVEAKKHT